VEADPPGLSPCHLADLRASGLSNETIVANQYRTVDGADVAKLLNWNAADRSPLGPCLSIPFFDIDGNPTNYVRLKPDQPRKLKDGKVAKYESPMGIPNRVYFPIGITESVKDPTVPLLITEGEKKAAAATQSGLPCLGLVGVYGWQMKRERDADGKAKGDRKLVDALAAIAWRGRPVTIVYDSDAVEKPEVLWAQWHLAKALQRQGAAVKVINPPPGTPGDDGKPTKQGLDDFLLAGGPEALRELLATAKPPSVPATAPRRGALASDLPRIRVGGRPLHELTDEALRAVLRRNDPPTVYQRGGMLTRLNHRRDDGAPQLEPLDAPALRGVLSRCARWVTRKRLPDGQQIDSVVSAGADGGGGQG
jgi:hypothetical protein